LLRDDLTGRAKLVTDADTGLVLGATFVGPVAGELLHAATVAIVGQVPVSTLEHAVVAFPTASEVWLHLLEKLERQKR
ncbi:MAG: pyridine nucleotide-disulfide oxidoreductase, partial [Micrococcaceae bacterium]